MGFRQKWLSLSGAHRGSLLPPLPLRSSPLFFSGQLRPPPTDSFCILALWTYWQRPQSRPPCYRYLVKTPDLFKWESTRKICLPLSLCNTTWDERERLHSLKATACQSRQPSKRAQCANSFDLHLIKDALCHREHIISYLFSNTLLYLQVQPRIQPGKPQSSS